MTMRGSPAIRKRSQSDVCREHTDITYHLAKHHELPIVANVEEFLRERVLPSVPGGIRGEAIVSERAST